MRFEMCIRDSVYIVRAAACRGAKLTLANQALSKIGKQGEIVGAKKPGELQLLAPTELPYIVQGYERGVGLVLLPRVDRVAVIAEAGIGGIQRKNRDKPRNIGEAVIPDAKQSEPVIADAKHPLAVEFVLLPVFQPIQESIAVRAVSYTHLPPHQS